MCQPPRQHGEIFSYLADFFEIENFQNSVLLHLVIILPSLRHCRFFFEITIDTSVKVNFVQPANF